MVLGQVFRFCSVFSVDCALFRPKRPPGPDFAPKQHFTERVLDTFSSFFWRKRLKYMYFSTFLGVLGPIFRLSGVFSVDCALFRPKRPPGGRYWAKTLAPGSPEAKAFAVGLRGLRRHRLEKKGISRSGPGGARTPRRPRSPKRSSTI